MRVLLKSPLKKAANNISRIGFSPKARRVRAFDFDRREEYKKFADFIKNSSEELANAPLPSKRELKKITNFDVIGGGGGGAGLLGGLLGLGGAALGAFSFGLPTIPLVRNPFNNNPKGKKPKPRRQKPGQRGRRGGRPGDRSRDSRNKNRNRRTQNSTTQRSGRAIQSRAEQRYRQRFGDKAGDRKFGKLNQGRVTGRGFRNPFRQKPTISGTGADRFRQGIRRGTRLPGQGARVTGGGLDRTLNSRPLRAIRQAGKFGLQGGKAVLGASRAMMRVFKRVPIIGSLLAGVLTYFQDTEGGNNPELPGGGPDGKPDMNLSKALFSAGGAALGGVIGSFIPIPVFGTLIGGIIGEYVGDLAYILIKGGGFQAVGQKLKEDIEKLLLVGGRVAGWAKDGFKRLYEGLPKIKLPDIPGWLKRIDILKVIRGLPWGAEVPDPQILLNPLKQFEVITKIPKAFFSRDPMDGSSAPENDQSDSEAKKRMIGQEATLNGEPVVWDGSKWVAPEILDDPGTDTIGEEPVAAAEGDPGLTQMSSSTVNVGLKDLVSVAAMTGRSDPGGPIMTSGRGMRNGQHHAGIDIGTGHQKGWYVSFRLKGKVSLVQYLGGYGHSVIIQASGKDFLFAHLARQSDLRPGQIYNGQIIGEIGNTGAGTGEHLHFEVRSVGGGTGTDMPAMPYVKYIMIGKLGSGTQQTMLAGLPGDASGDQSAQISPGSQQNREIGTDPRRPTAKNAGEQLMASLLQVVGALSGGGEQQEQPSQVASASSPQAAPQNQRSGQNPQHMVQSGALNNYWQTAFFSRLAG